MLCLTLILESQNRRYPMPESLPEITLKILIINEKRASAIQSKVVSTSQILKQQLEEHFKDKEEKFIFEAVEFTGAPYELFDKFDEFRPNYLIVDFSSLKDLEVTTFIKICKIFRYKPQAILAINMDPDRYKEVLRDKDNTYIFYLDKSKEMYSELVEALGNLWIRRYQYV